MTVTDVSTTGPVVIFRVKVILYRQWMVFMSLVIDLIGQLNCHVIGCKTRKSSRHNWHCCHGNEV